MPAAVAKGLQINRTLKNKKTVFDDDGQPVAKGQHQEQRGKKPKGPPQQEAAKQKFQNLNGQTKKPKIIFDDEGNVEKTQKVKLNHNKTAERTKPPEAANKFIFDENGEVNKSQRIKFDDDSSEDDKKVVNKAGKQYKLEVDYDPQKKWYEVYTKYPCDDEVLDMKENEQLELFNLCKSAFETEKSAYNKRNPSDSRWLQTALHKGTAKDRANAGALLVTSNPLGNLEALTTLIAFCKISNKSCNDVITILTDLWKTVLLPPQRKLISVHMRGADWKALKKDSNIQKEQQRHIYAYWYFESELKDHYFEFLKNIMQGLQTGQDHHKNAGIIAAAHLLAYGPEKEQMLLTMLTNKLGDPIAKIASKALHHLTEVAHQHPNMCGVIVGECEKLLFRNNISERAQHFALCFLASIAPSGRADVCTKLVNICFSLFKVLVQKGAVNNRTMQAILRCLQKAIVDAKPNKGSTELLNKEMQDTIYRLVHLGDIRISVQTLGLLLQLVTVKTEKSDRFYNALYVKLLDLNLINIGSKTAAQLLHIVHRAMHIDAHVERVQAFIKRLLQLGLYAPPQIAAGCLIVLHKLLRMRRELKAGSGSDVTEETKISANTIIPDLDKFGSDDEEETYADVHVANGEKLENKEVKPAEESAAPTKVKSSWHHATLAAAADLETKVRDIDTCKYDPYHRVPAFAGAAYTLRNELVLLRQHYHPTVQVFAEQILLQKRIDYYGDPLRDFALPYFLERFAFKNPKKLDNQHAENPSMAHKRYIAHGARGKPVKSLTKTNCTEDEMYIFNFLEQKRKHAEFVKEAKKPAVETEEGEADDELKVGEVDDDEFEAYLDGFFGKKAKTAEANEEGDEELNFLEELGGEMQMQKSKKNDKKKKTAKSDAADDEEISDIENDWGDDADEDNEEVGSDDETGSVDLQALSDMENSDDEGSVSLDETAQDNEESDSSEAPSELDEEVNDDDDDDDDDDEDDDDDDDGLPPKKKSRKNLVSAVDERSFAKKLKHSDDMSSLFAAADDFSALLEETGKTKGQGTINSVFNKDKSSDKQLKWEEKRRSNSKNYTSKKFAGKVTSKKMTPQLGKKRKVH